MATAFCTGLHRYVWVSHDEPQQAPWQAAWTLANVAAAAAAAERDMPLTGSRSIPSLAECASSADKHSMHVGKQPASVGWNDGSGAWHDVPGGIPEHFEVGWTGLAC